MQPEVCDVGIVGYGPVAATLAALLLQHGCSVVIWEKEATPYALPRAVHLDGEVMRILQQVGVAEALEPELFVNLGMRFVDADQNLLIDWPRPQEIGPQGWRASYRIHQPDLEATLRQTLSKHSALEIHQGVEVIRATQDAKDVAIVARDRVTGAERETLCRYLVGCDGARSFVREQIGAGLVDLRSNAQWLVVDVVMKRPVDTLSDWTVQLCDPARPTTIARGVGNRRRWEFMVMPGDDTSRLTAPDHVWSLLSRWIGPDDADVERTAVYRFNAVVADRWRHGRMLIAGDAAHQTPPFLGQGLCAGIRDASNLAWKLAAVLEGAVPAALLDSYESERAPHVREFVSQAVRVGEVLQATAEEAVRHHEVRASKGPEQMSTPAPDLGPGLHDPSDRLGGKLSVQPRQADGRRMDDLVGNRFVMLVRPDMQPALEKLIASLPTGGEREIVVLSDPDGSLEHYGVAGLLVRPDRYILASIADETAAPSLLNAYKFASLFDRGKWSKNVQLDENAGGARPFLAAG